MGVPATPPCVRMRVKPSAAIASMAQRVEGHVEGHVHGLAALRGGLAGDGADALERGLVEPERARGVPLEAPEHDAVRPEGERDAGVGLHHLDLTSAVHEVPAARAHHRHHAGAPGVRVLDRGLDDPHRGRRAADGQVVAELDAARARLDGGGHVGVVLGAELAQKVGHGRS